MEALGAAFWALLLVYWIVADTNSRHAASCYDYFFLCMVFFPLSLFWHCFRSRGWRGCFTLLLLALMWIIPYLIANVVWSILYGGGVWLGS